MSRAGDKKGFDPFCTPEDVQGDTDGHGQMS